MVESIAVGSELQTLAEAALDAALRGDFLPWGVLADYLRDRGHDAAADALREQFDYTERLPWIRGTVVHRAMVANCLAANLNGLVFHRFQANGNGFAKTVSYCLAEPGANVAAGTRSKSVTVTDRFNTVEGTTKRCGHFAALVSHNGVPAEFGEIDLDRWIG